MTFFERVWASAADAFGKRAGAPESLTPYSATWRMIVGRAEHALWVWNDKYGPLNPSQRDYAADLICSALERASAQAEVGDRYAFFHAGLTSMLNHEKVDAGFTRRGDAQVSARVAEMFDDVLQSAVA